MEYRYLKLERDGKVALLYINRPQQLNALNRELLQELERALEEVEADGEIGALVITGQGRAFVAGADIREMKDFGPQEAEAFSRLGHRVMARLESMSKPVVAAVNGFALGGGLELAMSCDFIYAAEGAQLGQPEINLGIIPGFGGTQRLSRRIGRARAKELILTGRTVSAQEALSWGLVNRVVPADRLLEEAKAVARQMADKGAVALRLAKRAVDEGVEMDLRRGCTLEQELFALCFSTEDQREGMTAFLEKRPPAFRGR